jgi:hypothetical protein
MIFKELLIITIFGYIILFLIFLGDVFVDTSPEDYVYVWYNHKIVIQNKKLKLLRKYTKIKKFWKR